jgi:hypothetical protein
MLSGRDADRRVARLFRPAVLSMQPEPIADRLGHFALKLLRLRVPRAVIKLHRHRLSS